MSDLAKYVREHTARGACRCGLCADREEGGSPLPGHTADVFFFDVAAKDNPTAGALASLIHSHRGEFGRADVLDGAEHSYIELGGWLGDQGVALQLTGLGQLLGLWDVLHPGNVLGLPKDDGTAQKLAGMGMVTVKKRES